jgi:hypothetical protein
MEVSFQTKRVLGVVQVQNVVSKKLKVTTFSQYVHGFIRGLKKILRKIDNLKDVSVHISGLDRNNTIHEWIISANDIVNEMLSLNVHLDRTVFIYIRKRTQILFLGSMGV